MTRMLREPVATAGALLAGAGAVILLGIITAEALYPAPYATDVNTISDLGGTRPPEGVVRQPSAAIFDATMVVSGLMILAGALFLVRAARGRAVTLPVALLGVGVLGVGIFPGNTSPHPFFALLAFGAGGLAGVLSARSLPAPMRQISAALGAVALCALALGLFLVDSEPVASLGEGGIERWIAYPVVLWLVALRRLPVRRGAGRDRRRWHRVRFRGRERRRRRVGLGDARGSGLRDRGGIREGLGDGFRRHDAPYTPRGPARHIAIRPPSCREPSPLTASE